MTQLLSRLLLILILSIVHSANLSIAMAAEDVLQRVPDNALGFALVRDLAETNTKFDRLMEPFGVAFPAPLTFAKIVTGLEEGIDLTGNLLIAFLPGTGPQSDFEPMVLLPLTNYQEFAASINADASGEICRITLMGEDILVAQNGPYAMLMNVEHQQTMYERIALQPQPVAALAPAKTWLSKQNLAFVLMPAGVEQSRLWKRQPPRRFGMGSQFGQSRSMFAEIFAGLFGPASRNWFRSHVSLAAIGVAVDDESNVRLGQQLAFKADSPYAMREPPAISRRTEKLGLSQQPFVFTASGTFAAGWGKQLAAYWRQMEQSQSKEMGFELVSAELWEKEEQAFRYLLEDIRACSVMMLAGQRGEPLLGNFIGVATVPDVAEYLKSLPTVVETWNEITQLSTGDIKLEVELTPLTVTSGSGEERRGYEFVVDVASQAQDPNVPALNWIYESALGAEGKLRVRLLSVDSHTFAFGLASQEQLAELVREVSLPASKQPQTPASSVTMKLLQRAAQWKMLINPQGCLHWASRVANELLFTLESQKLEIPEMQATPPVGITADWTMGQCGCEFVCPAATWKALANFFSDFNNP